MYAQWHKTPPGMVTVGFDSNNGSPLDLVDITSGGTVSKPAADPARTGYTFGGWYTDNGTFTKPYVFTAPVTGNITLYAKWSPINYTVVFDKNDPAATGAMPDQAFVYDTAQNLDTNIYSLPGFVFAGWATTDTGSVEYADGENVQNLAATDGAAVTLFAVWSNNTYTVGYNANGGSGTMTASVFVVGGSENLPINTFTRTGYTFAGWSTTAGGTVEYTNGGSVTGLCSTPGETVTLFAKWTANAYSVAFNANGGTGTMTNQSFVYGTAQNLKANTFTRTGYIFDGWAASASGAAVYTNQQSVNNLTSTNNGTVTLYAKWFGPLWARTITAGAGTINTLFQGVAVDGSGNVYAVGLKGSTGSVTFASGVIAAGTNAGPNPVVVKYNASGAAQWARTITAGTSDTEFDGVAVDGSGNVYAVGRKYGTGSVTFASGVTAAGTSTECNPVVVKYNSSGTAQWARTITAGTSNTYFQGVAVDQAGNVYAVGYKNGTGSVTFASGVTAAGTSSDWNPVLVKYNASGAAQWARTITAGTSSTEFRGVAVDQAGNVYAVGQKEGTGSITFASGVTAAGTAYTNGGNPVLVKYNTSGTAQWARTLTAGSWVTSFEGVAVDQAGNVYAVGQKEGTGSVTFGSGVTATGTAGWNPLLVKYNTSGTAQWARTITAGTSNTYFQGVAVDQAGNVYAVGYKNDTGSVTFGSGITATGTSTSRNPVVVKYNTSGTAQWVHTITAGTSPTHFYSVAVDGSGNVYAVGQKEGTGSITFASGITAAGTASYNPVVVKYGR